MTNHIILYSLAFRLVDVVCCRTDVKLMTEDQTVITEERLTSREHFSDWNRLRVAFGRIAETLE